MVCNESKFETSPIVFWRRQPISVTAFVALKIFMIFRLRPIALIPIFYYNENII